MKKAKIRPKQTNEQMIRKLKGEKLAVFLDKNNFCPDSPLDCLNPRCGECILKWLQKEAEE